MGDIDPMETSMGCMCRIKISMGYMYPMEVTQTRSQTCR
jgi:hypothetical protein